MSTPGVTMGPADGIQDLLAGLGDGAESATASVNGTTIHYVRMGAGPALVLIHGFPQDWFEWRRVMPRLAERFTVIAVDLRGAGGSAAPVDGYDAPGLAEDVAQLVDALGVGPVHVVGHDIGGMVAYAFARLHPDLTSSVMLIEMLLPGIELEKAPEIRVPLWHGGFHMVPDLPEALVQDRQAIYFRYFFDIGTTDPGVITEAEVQHYAAAYGDPAHLRAAFEMYRAFPANAAFNAEQTGPIDVPLLLVGGEHVFGPTMPVLAEHLRAHHGWADVQSVVVEGGRHYLPDEHAGVIAELIERHTAVR